MAQERYRRRSSIAEEFDTSLMYDDIEKIREREEEEEKDQNSKLGSAGMMAFFAGAALLTLSLVVGPGSDILPQLVEFLREAALPIIGFGALAYGFFKTVKLAFRQKELNFPALNVYRKTRPVPPGAEEAGTRQRTQSRANTSNRYQRPTRTYRRETSSSRKSLRRSRTNRVFSGVAGGLSEYTGISAALIRFAFIFSLFPTSGMSVFIYLLLSIVLPANYDSYQERGEGAPQPR
ncbi:MAG: PspC domain-containing protein [Bacteroidetes bacterium]|nr:MAG: PspC domain-containing protein [Bacteroidota bacterium]